MSSKPSKLSLGFTECILNEISDKRGNLKLNIKEGSYQHKLLVQGGFFKRLKKS